MVIIFVTVDSAEKAKKIAQTVLKEKLGIHVNVLPGVTSYRNSEDGEIMEINETLLLIKTKAVLYSAVESRMAELLSCTNCVMYSVPVTQMSQVFFDQVKHITLAGV